jgi:hypothetical protein
MRNTERTLLFSSNAGNVTSCNLSEPLSAFERVCIKTQPNVEWETWVTADAGNHRLNTYGSYNTDGYMVWPTNFNITNGTKTITVNRFQLLMQQATNTGLNLFGWNNTAANIKRIGAVWGVNRINPIETEGLGKPQGEGWKEYNETLLWSGTDYANQWVINLSGRALEYERLKVGVGSHGESPNFIEVDAPTTYSSWLPLYSWWGTSTAYFYYGNHRYRWGNETQTISAISGKVWPLGTGAANPYTTTGNYTATDTFIRRPLFAIWGINHKKPNKLTLLNSEGGSISASRANGYEFDIATLTNTTANEDYKFSSYNITGATLTGDQFQFGTNDVKVQGNFEHNKTLTLINGEHGVLSADKDKGFIGDIVTVTGTMDEGWYLTGFNTTGATMTGNKFAFAGEDVTVEGLYTDEGFPVVYEAENGVHLTGDPIAIPGQGISLTTSYDTYYRTNGYDITGGYIENGMLYATAACTARLKSKVNAFTATGGFEKGSNVTVTAKGTPHNAGVGTLYAIRNASTGSIPTAWYATSNRWKPSNASAYSITLKPSMYFKLTPNGYNALATAITMIGSTATQQKTYRNANATYSVTVTTSTQGVNYGISALLSAKGYGGYGGQTASTAQYVADNTTGTWTATGYAP